MADIINEKLKPSKTFNWFFEPYELVEPQKINHNSLCETETYEVGDTE